MLPNHRRDKILEFLQEDGSAKVLDLAKLFKVTEVTIRQDLEKLEKEGLIVRGHGGAFLKDVTNQVKGFTLSHQENLDKKELIAKKSLEFIESGDTIILDSGSTTTEIAKKLKVIENKRKKTKKICFVVRARSMARSHLFINLPVRRRPSDRSKVLVLA